MGHIDFEGMRARLDAARLKQMLGEPLDDRELRILQMEQHGFGCTACGHHHRYADEHEPGPAHPPPD